MGIWETVFFYIFAVGAISASAAVVVLRNPLYSAIALILDFFFFAGLYALLSAHFMAIIQVLVYGGAIMVLFVFIIMLLNLRDHELERPSFRMNHVLGVMTGFALFILLYSAFVPLTNKVQVQADREAAVEAHQARLANLGESEEEPRLKIGTMLMPGLWVDLNEAELHYQYDLRMRHYTDGRFLPSDRKYPRFDDDVEFVIPPVLSGESDRYQARFSKPTFGTVEPISVMLVNRFVIPFELTAILLLAAVIGAVIIAKKRV